MKLKPRIKNGIILFNIGVILQVFGAVYQPTELGYLASSPGNIFLLISIVFSFDSIKTNLVSRLGWTLVACGYLASTVSLLFFGYNELYALKTLNLGVLNALWLSPLICSNFIVTTGLKRSLILALLICGGAVFTSDIFPALLPDGLRRLIFAERLSNYWDVRMRGFMTETSHLAWLVSRYLLILILLNESGRKYQSYRFLASMVLVATVVLLIGSKGAAFGVAITLASIIFDKRRWYLALLLLPMAAFVLVYQVDSIIFDVENRTSTATRTGLALASIFAFADNPIGWGYYGFYGVLREAGMKAIGIINNIGLDSSEILKITDEFDSVSFKSSIGDFIVVNGFLFIYVVSRLVSRVDLSDPRARSGLIFFMVSGLSCSGNESIGFFLGLAVLSKYYSKKQLRDKI